MDITELEPGQLVALGRTLLKVSSIYADHVTAEVVFPPQKRTVVRHYTLAEVRAFAKPSHDLIGQYEVRFHLPRTEA